MQSHGLDWAPGDDDGRIGPPPSFTLVVPVWNTDPDALRALFQSVRGAAVRRMGHVDRRRCIHATRDAPRARRSGDGPACPGHAPSTGTPESVGRRARGSPAPPEHGSRSWTTTTSSTPTRCSTSPGWCVRFRTSRWCTPTRIDCAPMARSAIPRGSPRGPSTSSDRRIASCTCAATGGPCSMHSVGYAKASTAARTTTCCCGWATPSTPRASATLPVPATTGARRQDPSRATRRRSRGHSRPRAARSPTRCGGGTCAGASNPTTCSAGITPDTRSSAAPARPWS